MKGRTDNIPRWKKLKIMSHDGRIDNISRWKKLKIISLDGRTDNILRWKKLTRRMLRKTRSDAKREKILITLLLVR